MKNVKFSMTITNGKIKNSLIQNKANEETEEISKS